MRLRIPADENRFETNMTPMIDIIFQLLIFFMCATKFRLLEGKLTSYLPKGKGTRPTTEIVVPPEEIRIELRQRDGALTVRVGEAAIRTEEDVRRIVAEPYHDFRSHGMPVSVILDSDAGVPTRDVVRVLNDCIKTGVPDVEFADRGE